MKNFRTYQLAVQFYKECLSLRLSGAFKDQFDRASLSVVLNLAEGSGKPTAKDRKRFYSIAMGSLRETQAILELSGNIAHLERSDKLAACLYRLIQNPGSST